MYEARTFDIPELKGISQKSIDEHLKLYQGYVKHTNLILEKMKEEKEGYEESEARRRLGFEFDGMRNHEYYFEQLEGGPSDPEKEHPLNKKIEKDFGSMKQAYNDFKKVASTRGVGWAVLYYDQEHDTLIQTWVDEQHLGQLNGLTFLFGVDMWEHSYMLDYAPSQKMEYFDAYTSNVNWSVIEKRFEKATKK